MFENLKEAIAAKKCGIEIGECVIEEENNKSEVDYYFAKKTMGNLAIVTCADTPAEASRFLRHNLPRIFNINPEPTKIDRLKSRFKKRC